MKILFDCTVICLTEILIIWLTDEIWLDTNDRLKLYLVDRLSECSTRWNLVWLFELLFHCLKSCLLDWNKVWLTGVLLGWVNSVFTDMFSLSSFHCCVCQIWLTEQWTAVWLTHIACKFVGLKKSEIFLDWLKSSLTDRLCYLTLLKLGLADWNVVWLDWNLVLTSWFAVSDKGFSMLFDWVKSGFEGLIFCFRQRLLHTVWQSEIRFWMPDLLFQTKAFSMLFDGVKSGFECLIFCFRQRFLHAHCSVVAAHLFASADTRRRQATLENRGRKCW